MGKKETFHMNKAWAFDLIGGKSLALRVNVISRRKALEAFKYSGPEYLHMFVNTGSHFEEDICLNLCL